LSMKQVRSFSYCTKYSTCRENFRIRSTADNTSASGVCIVPVEYAAENIQIDDTGKYSIFDIADWFLLKGNMTHKKLQKLCYYAQAWCFALKEYRLANTDFQAWVHGPVSPALYERFKGFGYETIVINTACKPTIDEEDLKLLEDVWETYGDKTGNALEALSHREIPWIEARQGFKDTERCAVIITPEAMRRYYRSIYNR